MGRFAWRNLLTRPLRTALALVGLSIPILGVIGLFSLSSGLRTLVGDTLERIQGVMIIADNVPSPVFSTLPAAHAKTLREVKGVRVVAPEVWFISPAVEDSRSFAKTIGNALTKQGSERFLSLLDTPVIQGMDIPTHMDLKSGVFSTSLKDRGEGRFLSLADQGTKNIVISRKTARDFPNEDGRPKRLGDKLRIGGEAYDIVGIYETGSMFLDVVIVMDINTARKIRGVADAQVSSFYVEMNDPSRNDEISAEIEKSLPGVDARTMNEFMANFGMLMGYLDKFLLMTVSLAVVVGVVGIINTMLMSTTERFVEFGVLRTNGWSRGNVLMLVTAESAYLGLLSGVIGGLLAISGAATANLFLGGGLKLSVHPGLFALGVGLSLVTGTLGGLYPAWKASRLVPMDAIRLGSH